MNQKSFYIVFASSLLILFVLIYQGTFAYFTANVTDERGENGGDTSLSTADLKDVTLIDGSNTEFDGWIPGDSHDFTFQIDNPGSPNLCAKLIWTDVINNWVNKEDLVYSLEDDEGNVIVEEEPFPTADNEVLVSSFQFEGNKKTTYTLTVTYKNDPDKDQKDDMGKTFQATITGQLTTCSTESESGGGVVSPLPDSVIAGLDKPDKEGNGLYTVDHKNDGTELSPEWTATPEYRYAGPDPNNYVWFNSDPGCTEEGDSEGKHCELWRIIGLVNVKTSSGIEQRVKIIRASSIGSYSWDSSASTVNSGYGVNEWSQADLKKLLNDYYYNGKDEQTCYNGSKETSIPCDFGSTRLKAEAKSMIDESIIWNTGANGTSDYTSASNGLAKHFYQYERSSNKGKICEPDKSYCSDAVERTTEWSKTSDSEYHGIGLMYPSDYGYATSGNSESEETNRAGCLAKEMYHWNSGSWITDCAENDWLKPTSGYYWTISPYSRSSHANTVFYVYSDGYVSNRSADHSHAVLPVVYLSKNVVIEGDVGSQDEPFTVRIAE